MFNVYICGIVTVILSLKRSLRNVFFRKEKHIKFYFSCKNEKSCKRLWFLIDYVHAEQPAFQCHSRTLRCLMQVYNANRLFFFSEMAQLKAVILVQKTVSKNRYQPLHVLLSEQKQPNIFWNSSGYSRLNKFMLFSCWQLLKCIFPHRTQQTNTAVLSVPT